MSRRFRHFSEFWPHYLHQHTMPGTRAMHIIGSFAALTLLAAALLAGPLWLLAVVPVAGYGPAWLAHALIEHNAPATFCAPLRSLLADWHMIGLWLGGRLGGEWRRYHVVAGEHRQPPAIGSPTDE